MTYLLAEDRVAKGGTRRDPTEFTGYVEDLTAQARDRMANVVDDVLAKLTAN